jgi:hypothetical protein
MAGARREKHHKALRRDRKGTKLRARALLALKTLDRRREARLRAGGRVRVNDIGRRGSIQLFHKREEFGFGFVELLLIDRGANFSQLRAERRFGGSITSAADRILPHAFLSAGCIGHGWKGLRR